MPGSSKHIWFHTELTGFSTGAGLIFLGGRGIVGAEGHGVGWEKEGKEFPSQEMVKLVYYSYF